ncbi:MAG: NADH-quinone oxidoreductase subunit J [bacterium]
MRHVLFFIFSIASIFAALMVISRKNVVHSALSLVLLFFTTSGLYILTGAELVAAMQIFLYAGAIIVIYIFVIMMINMRKGTTDDIENLPKIFIIGAGCLFFAEIMYFLSKANYAGMKDIYSVEKVNSSGGMTYNIAKIMYTKYLYPFEVISLILLIAMIGAIVLAKKADKK